MIYLLLALLICGLALGLHEAEKNADSYYDKYTQVNDERLDYRTALERIANHPSRNNGSALKKIAREAICDR